MGKLTLDIIKTLDIHKVSSGIFQFVYEDQIYYLKKIYFEKEYLISNELAKLNLKEFLIAEDLFVEKWNDKKPILPHIYKKDHYYMLTKEMKGKSLDIMITKLNDTEFKNVVSKIIEALEKAWREIQFFHGDIHLQNIMVDELQPVIFDFEYSSVYVKNKNKNFQKDLWEFLTNLALNTRNEKSEIVMQFVEKYFGSRTDFQESLYACLPHF